MGKNMRLTNVKDGADNIFLKSFIRIELLLMLQDQNTPS